MYTLVNNIPVWGEHDEATLGQIARCAHDPRVAGAALMATPRSISRNTCTTLATEGNEPGELP